MKKTILFFVAAAIGMLSANATNERGGPFTCTPVTTGCTAPFGAACPASLPDATAGNFYQEQITVYMPASVDTTLPLVGTVNIPVDSVTFIGVSGLPDGMFFNIDNNLSKFFPDSSDATTLFTCLQIFGSPCGGIQTVTITVDMLFDVTSPFGQFQLPQSFPVTFELISTVPVLEVTSTLDYLCSSGVGSDATLNAQSGFTTYEWSTAESTESIVVDAAGTYSLTVIDAIGCSQTASYEIFNLGAVLASGSTATICPNQILALEATGGAVFTWNASTNLSATNINNPVVFDLTSNATFTVTVSNGSCTDDATVTVTVSSSCVGACAQATPDRSCLPSIGAISSLCLDNLPVMTSGAPYDADVTFFFPAAIPLEDIVELAVGIALPGLPAINVSPDFVVVSDVLGLPAGLDWSCDQLDLGGNDCTYYPALAPAVTQYGAISFCGNPCGSTTTDTIRVVLTATATLPAAVPLIGGTVQDFDLELPVAFTITNSNPLTVAASQTGVLPVGTTVTLTAATGFSNFVWSTGATTAEITVNIGGSYTLSAFDGTCTQSTTVVVEYATGIENINATTLSIFPNPNKGNFEVAFDLKKATDITVSVLNVQGTEVYIETFAAKSGNNNKNVSLNNLSSGIYIVKMNVDGGSISRRITLF